MPRSQSSTNSSKKPRKTISKNSPTRKSLDSVSQKDKKDTFSRPKRKAPNFSLFLIFSIIIILGILGTSLFTYFQPQIDKILFSMKQDYSSSCNPEEISPVCGKDGNTYQNPCIARALNIDIIRFGSCGEKSISTGSTPDTLKSSHKENLHSPDIKKAIPDSSLSGEGGVSPSSSTWSYDPQRDITYENKNFGYTVSFNKRFYYRGNRGTDGAKHLLGIGFREDDVIEFSRAPVQIYYYDNPTIQTVQGEEIPLNRGKLIIRKNSDDPRVGEIINAVKGSARSF